MKNNSTVYMSLEKYPDLLTVNDLMSVLRVGRNTAYQLLHSRKIQSIKIGRSIRIPKRYLIDFVYGSCYNTPVASGLAQLKEV